MGEAMLTLKNCRLIPELSAGCALPLADVEVEGGKIARICPAGQGAGETGIDCQGKTLLPGLVDAHAHLIIAFDKNASVDIVSDTYRAFTQAALSAREFLRYGVTTLRELGGPHRVGYAVRDAIADGLFVGPRIQSSGCIIGATDYRKLVNRDMNTLADGPDECRKAARDEIAHGADVIKIYNSSYPFSAEKPCTELYTMEELRTFVEVAESKGTYVSAHCHCTKSIRMSLEAGVRTIEHATVLDDACLELVAKTGAWLVPTLTPLVAMHDMVQKGEPRTGFDRHIFDADAFLRMYEGMAAGLSRAYQARLPMAYGVDMEVSDFPALFGVEFAARKELMGCTDLDLLLQATVEGARLMGLSQVTGQVREGLAADLILVDGHPDRDISLLAKGPELVLMGGEIVRRDSAPAQ